jgi:hypothetical protein
MFQKHIDKYGGYKAEPFRTAISNPILNVKGNVIPIYAQKKQEKIHVEHHLEKFQHMISPLLLILDLH